MSGRSSRVKGASAEREAFALLNSLLMREAFKRNLSQTRAGGYDHEPLSAPVAVEVKRCETLALGKWMKQAEEQAPGLTPAVMYRRNKEPWSVLVKMTPEQFSLWLDWQL